MRYFCWAIFSNLDPFGLTKFIELIWSLDLGSNICFGLCTFLDIYFGLFLSLHRLILQFYWLSTDLWHIEHEISWKKVRIKKLWEDIELVVSLFWYTFYFPFLFGFVFISSEIFVCRYLLVVYRIEHRINQKFCLHKRNNSINMF